MVSAAVIGAAICAGRAATEAELPALRADVAAAFLAAPGLFAGGFAGLFLGAAFARVGIVFLRMAAWPLSQFLYRNLKLGQAFGKRKALKLQDSPQEFRFAGPAARPRDFFDLIKYITIGL
ncbi:MAG TPA: hypothetical protein VJR47_09230 [Stellaceae bacterium]|nr:hypothetical protein [Stellaceae bacterium]